MESKQIISLEVKKGDFTFTFNMQAGASWGNAIDAAFDFLQEVNSLASASVSAQKPAEPVQQPIEGN